SGSGPSPGFGSSCWCLPDVDFVHFPRAHMNVAGDAERTADLVVLEHHHPRLPAFDRESGKDLGLTTFTVRRQVVEPREPCFLQERVQRPGLDHRLDLVIPRITGAEVQQVLEPRTTPWVRTELSEQGFPASSAKLGFGSTHNTYQPICSKQRELLVEAPSLAPTSQA